MRGFFGEYLTRHFCGVIDNNKVFYVSTSKRVGRLSAPIVRLFACNKSAFIYL